MVATRLIFAIRKSKLGLIFLHHETYIDCLPAKVAKILNFAQVFLRRILKKARNIKMLRKSHVKCMNTIRGIAVANLKHTNSNSRSGRFLKVSSWMFVKRLF